ncbi:MAG TPA: hypothetical protein PLH36_06555, partial [Armatimonadota bacterium]|nr:hypothetical protein [Armatimonadota bacterium]
MEKKRLERIEKRLALLLRHPRQDRLQAVGAKTRHLIHHLSTPRAQPERSPPSVARIMLADQ